MTQFTPDKIPSEYTVDLYVHYYTEGSAAGTINVSSHDMSCFGDRVVICEQEVTFNIPPQDGLKGKVLDMLQEQKSKILAENHQRLQAIQEKIDNLLAIEYQPDSEAANA